MSVPLDENVIIPASSRPMGAKLTRYKNETEKELVRLECVKLRRDGYTYVEIGEKLGLNYATATQFVKEVLTRRPAEDIEAVRALELERLDKMHNRVAKFDEKLPDGSFSKDSIETQLKIATRRAALQGLDAAQKFEVVTKVDPDALTALTDEELMLFKQLYAKVKLGSAVKTIPAPAPAPALPEPDADA